MNLQRIYDLLSGRERGLTATLKRTGLWLAQAPYFAATVWRNRQFDRHARRLEANPSGNSSGNSSGNKIRRVSAPVVSVGNITTGGTGKTPMVEYVARWLRQQSVRVAIVSRGYGAQEGDRNDEAIELERRLPDVPHLQDPNRVDAASLAIEELATQAIVLDDGFQHRRLHRDLDLVLLDATEPFGFGHVLPRGLLRESLRGLRRADALVLSRADAVDDDERRAIRERAMHFAPGKPWIEVSHAPTQWVSTMDEYPLECLRGKRVAGFCGIGNPTGFRRSIEQCGCELTDLRVFPDHHNYQAADVKDIGQWAAASNADAIVCTEKDLAKLQIDDVGGKPLRALRIQLAVLENEAGFHELLQPIAQAALAIQFQGVDDGLQ